MLSRFFFTSLEVFVCLSKTDCCLLLKTNSLLRRSKLSITGSSTGYPLFLLWICWCWYSNWCWCWGWRRRRGWLWIFPRRRSIPSNEGSRPFRPIYQSPPKWPPSPSHPQFTHCPRSAEAPCWCWCPLDIVVVVAPFTFSLSLWSISPLFLIKAMGFWLHNRICLSVKILNENWNTMN